MQIDYITLPQTCQGKHYVITMVEATTKWLETYPLPHTTTWALKSMSYGNMAPQKELSQTVGLISETTS